MEKTPGPAIEVIGGDDMGSLVEKLKHRRAAFEFSERRLERGA
jgi:hypothetical protein